MIGFIFAWCHKATYLNLKSVAECHRRGDATKRPYRGDLETLLRELPPGANTANEPRRITDCGIPDYVLARGSTSCHFVAVAWTERCAIIRLRIHHIFGRKDVT